MSGKTSLRCWSATFGEAIHQIYTKRKMVQRKLELWIQTKNQWRKKTNLQQQKDLESGSRKPNKIQRHVFKLCKRKSREETNREITSSSERLNITNDRLLPILTSLETDTTTAINDATEEPIEADRSWFFRGNSKSHKSDMMSSKLIKKKKQESRKIPKNQEKRKTINKSKLKKKQNRKENLQNE